MRFWFSGVVIEERPLSFLSGFASRPSALVEPGNIVYAVEGSDWSGYVVAGILRTSEDEGEVNDPSPLL